MQAHHPPVLAPVPAVAAASICGGESDMIGLEALAPVPGVAAAPDCGRSARLPETVYRRRRLAVAVIAVAALTLVLAWGRSDRVPLGEANPWPSTGDASISDDLGGVYVVQPGDTLWDIALAIAPGDDPRSLVHDLAEAAGGAALEPGQQIVIDAVGAMAVASDSNRLNDQPAAAPDDPAT